MDVLYLNGGRDVQIGVSKVPNSPDRTFAQLLCNLDRLLLRDRKDHDINLIVLYKGLQLIHPVNLNASDLPSDQLLIAIERCLEIKAPVSVVHIVHQR